MFSSILFWFLTKTYKIQTAMNVTYNRQFSGAYEVGLTQQQFPYNNSVQSV